MINHLANIGIPNETALLRHDLFIVFFLSSYEFSYLKPYVSPEEVERGEDDYVVSHRAPPFLPNFPGFGGVWTDGWFVRPRFTRAAHLLMRGNEKRQLRVGALPQDE